MHAELESTPTRRRFRFTIGTLLLFTLCVGGLLGGFRAGYLWGFSRGAAEQAAERPFPKVYATADLDLPDGVDGLIELITTSIEPTSWDMVGGPGSACPYENPMVLIVCQTPTIHDHIAELLRQLRQHPAPLKKSPSTAAPNNK